MRISLPITFACRPVRRRTSVVTGSRREGGLRHDNEPVTLASIAEAVGVHVSTVSRVLRSQTPRTDTAIRIVETARDLGYTPHRAAASLRTRNSKLIGVLLPRLTDYVPARIYEGVDDAASTAGYTTVIAKSGDDPSRRLDRLEALLALRVDGVIVCDARLRDDQVVEELQAPWCSLHPRLPPRARPGQRDDERPSWWSTGRRAPCRSRPRAHRRRRRPPAPQHWPRATPRLRRGAEEARPPASGSAGRPIRLRCQRRPRLSPAPARHSIPV